MLVWIKYKESEKVRKRLLFLYYSVTICCLCKFANNKTYSTFECKLLYASFNFLEISHRKTKAFCLICKNIPIRFVKALQTYQRFIRRIILLSTPLQILSIVMFIVMKTYYSYVFYKNQNLATFCYTNNKSGNSLQAWKNLWFRMYMHATPVLTDSLLYLQSYFRCKL